MMNKRLLVIGAIGAATLLFTLAYLVLSGSSGESQPVATAAPTETPTPRPTPRYIPRPDHDKGIPKVAARFPVVKKLPYYTRYWRLVIDGEVKDGVIPLEATVYAKSKESARRTADKQKAYIEAFLRSVGQKPGTYRLQIITDVAPDGV